jgi:hypothetical protein
MERAKRAVFVPSTARSQLKGNVMDDDPPNFEKTYPSPVAASITEPEQAE